MKTKITPIKEHLIEHANEYTALVSMVAVGLIGMSYAADRAKRKTASDLKVTSARDFINAETGELSDLFITHRDGSVTILKSHQV